MYQNLGEEKNMLKQAETRLMEENKSLINQQKGQNTLLTNLQSIQVIFEPTSLSEEGSKIMLWRSDHHSANRPLYSADKGSR
jgi:hypothetical protein